jgi:SAM-dependent methyltransferase
MLLYTALADWYPLLSPLEDYDEEVEVFGAIFREALGAPPPGARWRLLELGCGPGHIAHGLADHFDLTLTDLSPQMLALAARTCPGARLSPGDMRSLRLGHQFDAVLLHDAVSYLRGSAELAAALATAAAHLRLGGVLVVAPDYVRESFAPACEEGGADDGGRALRYVAFVNPAEGDGYSVDYVYVTKDGAAEPKVYQERHLEGLYTRDEWSAALSAAGFQRIGPPSWRHSEVDRDLDIFVARYVGAPAAT